MSKLEFKIPEGYELDKENSTDETIIYKKKEKKYPLSWDDYVNNFSCPEWLRDHYRVYSGTPEKYIALGKLEILRDAWNEINGFEADWTDTISKFTIDFYKRQIRGSNYSYLNKILYFGSEKTRDLFLETFRDLIETAKELL